MKDQQAYHYGVVSGFLLGVSAPADVIRSLDSAVIAREVKQRVVQEEARGAPYLPPPARKAIEPLPEVEDPPIQEEDEGRGWPQWKKSRLIELKAAGIKAKDIGAELGKKETQINSMWNYLKKHKRDEANINPKPADLAKREPYQYEEDGKKITNYPPYHSGIKEDDEDVKFLQRDSDDD